MPYKNYRTCLMLNINYSARKNLPISSVVTEKNQASGLFINAFFYLFLYIVFGIFKLPDTTTNASHKFRYFTATKQNKYSKDDDYPL